MESPNPSSSLPRESGKGTDPTSALAALVYPELCALAAKQLRAERSDHTLRTAALVHEAYLRLHRQRKDVFRDRQKFLALAASMMRRILVDHARSRRAARRGGDRVFVGGQDPIEQAESEVDRVDILDLHDALERLAQRNSRRARVVELRFFGGLAMPEIAAELGVSLRTVTEDWAFSRAWLLREIG